MPYLKRAKTKRIQSVEGAVKVKSANVLDLVRIISSDSLYLDLAERKHMDSPTIGLESLVMCEISKDRHLQCQRK